MPALFSQEKRYLHDTKPPNSNVHDGYIDQPLKPAVLLKNEAPTSSSPGVFLDGRSAIFMIRSPKIAILIIIDP